MDINLCMPVHGGLKGLRRRTARHNNAVKHNLTLSGDDSMCWQDRVFRTCSRGCEDLWQVLETSTLCCGQLV